MNDFIDINILSTIAGCSALVSLLTQVFKKYVPDKIDTKWLALVFSVIIGVIRLVYVGQFDFAGITSGVINIFILLAVAVGLYEVGSSVAGAVLTDYSTVTDDTTGGETSDEEK